MSMDRIKQAMQEVVVLVRLYADDLEKLIGEMDDLTVVEITNRVTETVEKTEAAFKSVFQFMGEGK